MTSKRPHQLPPLAEPRRYVAGATVVLLLAGALGCTFGKQEPTREGLDAAIDSIERFIEREMESKDIPAISIAIVDDQQTVWSEGFGLQDPDTKTPATADTIYRVGSVSKMFTDIAVMQLVEQGKLDLDGDVRDVIPEFEPSNDSGEAITLRQLMAHRAGLVREPPVGHYFDPTEPTLAATVQSLEGSKLVYQPESRMKYSNAGIAVVGYAVEKAVDAPFAEYVREQVLEPAGMLHSDFRVTEAMQGSLARGVMWTRDDQSFPAPSFQLGMAPAGSLYTSVNDLARFMAVLFRDGDGLLSRDSLHQMYQPQFRDVDPAATYGFGFVQTELGGHRAMRHGGAIYGFSTELTVLPEQKLGVVVVASKDFTNAVVTRIANHALDVMLRPGESLRDPESSVPIPRGRARALAGLYRSGSEVIRLEARGDRLFMDRGPELRELRHTSENSGTLIVDSALAFGPRIEVLPSGGLVIEDETFERVEDPIPPPAPERWEALIGEYGWDHNVLYILEKNGALHALIEWFESYPLEEVSENLFRFPDYGLYHGEELVFARRPGQPATSVLTAGIVFERRDVGTEARETFRIEPLQPIEALRASALSATPPVETGTFRDSDLMELTELDPSIRLDIRYATTHNFMGSVFYKQPRAFLQQPAAEAAVRVHQALSAKGYGLFVHDAYRPWYVTKMFYDATPDAQKIFVADPSQGSRHNRGCAVDLTLYELETGLPVEMVSGYDEFSPRAFPGYPGGTSSQRWLRRLLRGAMEAEGFSVYEFEWWHFDYGGWELYRIGNETFEEL